MLTNVHEALQEAVIESKRPPKLDKTFTFRSDAQTTEEAEKICAANGTTLSMYLRKCIDALVKDYKQP